MTIIKITQKIIVGLAFVLLSGCSLNKFSSSVSSIFIEDSIESLNTDTDLVRVKKQFPDNITMLEQLIKNDTNNKRLHIYAAQAYYSYAFAFIEDNNSSRAVALYHEAYLHALAAITSHGITLSDLQGKSPLLTQKINKLDKTSVDALYWLAISWAKVIETKPVNFLLLTQLHKTAILMGRVIKLDETYQLAGPNLFFAVYYASRPNYLGGSDYLSGKYFERARVLNKNRLLIVDYLQAKYLNGRVHGEVVFTQRLHKIINSPDDLYPEQALLNAIAKKKASNLLKIHQEI